MDVDCSLLISMCSVFIVSVYSVHSSCNSDIWTEVRLSLAVREGGRGRPGERPAVLSDQRFEPPVLAPSIAKPKGRLNAECLPLECCRDQ